MAAAWRKPRTVMSQGQYLIVADVIRKILDPAIRQQMADHFATEFNKRSAAFDPVQWGRSTGGKVAPNSARIAG